MPDQLEKLIQAAEKRFGPRTKGLTLAPVEDHRLDYPETVIQNGVIRVEITASTRRFPLQKVQQLAHEAIHCLIASGRRDTIYLKEGLAHHFVYTYSGLSREYRQENAKMLHPIFKPAVDAFKALKATDAQIRALRVDFPTMGDRRRRAQVLQCKTRSR